MKRIALTLAVSTLILAGCSVPDDPAPVVTHTEVSTPAPSVTPEKVDAEPVPFNSNFPELTKEEIEGVFLMTLRDGDSSLELVDDESILELGYTVCETLGSGVSLDTMFTAVVADGNDPEFAGQVVGAAIAGLCPEFNADMQAFIAANG